MPKQIEKRKKLLNFDHAMERIFQHALSHTSCKCSPLRDAPKLPTLEAPFGLVMHTPALAIMHLAAQFLLLQGLCTHIPLQAMCFAAPEPTEPPFALGLRVFLSGRQCTLLRFIPLSYTILGMIKFRQFLFDLFPTHPGIKKRGGLI